MPARGGAYNFVAVQLSTIDQQGYWTGQAGTSLSAGNASSAYLSRNGLSSGFGGADPTIINFETEETNVAVGGGEIDPFDLEIEVHDTDLLALAAGSNKDVTTNDKVTIGAPRRGGITLPDIGLILTEEFISFESASTGATYYINHIIPVAKIVASKNNLAFRDKSTYRLRVTPKMGTRMPHGVPFGTAQGFYKNKTDYFYIISEAPLAFTAFVANGVATTFNVPYLPYSTVAGTASSTYNWMAINGTATAIDALNTAGQVTLAAAGDSADKIGILYHTADFDAAA